MKNKDAVTCIRREKGTTKVKADHFKIEILEILMYVCTFLIQVIVTLITPKPKELPLIPLHLIRQYLVQPITYELSQ